MKTKLIFILMLSFPAVAVFAKELTVEFKVFGNCEKCEARIEKAALSVDGVLKADWNHKTNILEVTFEDTTIGSKEIHLAIAKTGHDTDLVFAISEDYNTLPMCCRYDRPKETIYGSKRVVTVPPGCNPAKLSTHSTSCCNLDK
jgi:copper chaperone CopZ